LAPLAFVLPRIVSAIADRSVSDLKVTELAKAAALHSWGAQESRVGIRAGAPPAIQTRKNLSGPDHQPPDHSDFHSNGLESAPFVRRGLLLFIQIWTYRCTTN
jgi:hypothetical protein